MCSLRLRILLCPLILLPFISSFLLAQDSSTSAQERKKNAVPKRSVSIKFYRKWLEEDVPYIITDDERADFTRLETDQQRDKFVEDFWERRNPNPGSEENVFKEEHYRRIAYTNEHFAASIPGWKTDRGRIYIVYGPPDEREQHPANHNPNLPEDDSSTHRYATDIWRYNFIPGLGRNVFFDFVDKCDCGEFQLIHDPTKRRARQVPNEEKLVPVSRWRFDR